MRLVLELDTNKDKGNKTFQHGTGAISRSANNPYDYPNPESSYPTEDTDNPEMKKGSKKLKKKPTNEAIKRSPMMMENNEDLMSMKQANQTGMMRRGTSSLEGCDEETMDKKKNAMKSEYKAGTDYIKRGSYKYGTNEVNPPEEEQTNEYWQQKSAKDEETRKFNQRPTWEREGFNSQAEMDRKNYGTQENKNRFKMREDTRNMVDEENARKIELMSKRNEAKKTNANSNVSWFNNQDEKSDETQNETAYEFKKRAAAHRNKINDIKTDNAKSFLDNIDAYIKSLTSQNKK